MVFPGGGESGGDAFVAKVAGDENMHRPWSGIQEPLVKFLERIVGLPEEVRSEGREVASAGFYKSPWGKQYAKLQVITVGELLAGRKVEYPDAAGVNVTFKKAPRAKRTKAQQMNLGYHDE